jgi:hypothetical protein
MQLRPICGTILLVGGILGLSTPAHAESITIPFRVTVPPRCVFALPRPGILVVGAQSNQLEASADRGELGSVEIFCNTAATVTVSDPINTGNTGGTNFNGAFYGAYIQAGAKLATSPNAKANNWPSAFTQNSIPIAAGFRKSKIKVGMIRETKDAALQAGTYSFKVTLTSTP